MAQVKNERTRVLADDLIDAAQILEKQAKTLRETARIIREYGLLTLSEGIDAVQNQRMHKASNVQYTCQCAVDVLDKVEVSG